jgi:N,N-dimethylformamidase
MSDQTHAAMPIAGYLDRLSARAGERIAVKVSAQGGGDYAASLVRVINGDPNPAGGGMRLEALPSAFEGRWPARDQPVHLGSYAVCPSHPSLGGSCLVVGMLVQPWLLRGVASTLMSSRAQGGNGWSLDASEDRLSFSCGGHVVSLQVAMKRRRWYRVWGGFDVGSGRLMVGCQPCDAKGSEEVQWLERAAVLTPAAAAPILIAARQEERVKGHFNGRIEDPALWSRWPARGEWPGDPCSHHGAGLLAWWDFSVEIPTQAIIDRGPKGLHGRLVNVPTRAVCGARWSGREMCWRAAPRDYAAIHFHEDDLYDCGWETDFDFEVPADLTSGVYAVRLSKGEDEDIVPFFVLPPKGKRTADVCYLAATFTYQVYANHARGNYDEAMRRRIADWNAARNVPDNYPLYGRSTYNFHPDGSGHAFSSRLRPMLTMRPGFLTFVDARGSGLRHFPADTHLTDWLTAKDIAFDVITDEDLDDEGVDLIKDYPTVLTGSHPEYHTPGTLDALEAYLGHGGNLVYLGGNGFYWRIARSASLPGMLEIRRAEGGIRAWSAEPGEYYNSLDGAYGGLWRRNARPPQRLVGIGFSGQGMFEGSYYRRLPDSYSPEAAWIFDGVEEEILGDFGLSGGGAAGFELDRTYRDLGTPDNVLVLARSECHGDSFIPVPEELLTHIATASGEPRDALVRAEIVYFDTPAGGAVFSVGSITFCGSLPHNDHDNPISRMLENVVRRFSSRTSQ